METLDSKTVTSELQYDPSNNFVYAPIDRQLAFDCERILKNEEFVIRRNILYNIQASKYYHVLTLFATSTNKEADSNAVTCATLQTQHICNLKTI